MKKQDEIKRNFWNVLSRVKHGGGLWKMAWAGGLCLLLQGVFPADVSGAILYVSPSGSHTVPYDSWAAAATNVSAATAIAQDGDSILVGNGIYLLAEQIAVTNAVTIRSENGALNAVIDGNNLCRCFYLSHADALIDGFTLQRGKADEGGGVYLREGGTVQNCIISSNAAPSGAGAFMYYGGLIQSSLIIDNRATTTNVQPAGNFFYGGGVHCYNGGTVQDCTIRDNAATSEGCPSNTSYYCYGGGVYAWHAGIIQNCLIAGNQAIARNAAAGGGVYLHEESLLRNCIVSSNIAAAGGSAFPTGEGGGVYIDLAGTVEACTIVQNRAIGTYSGAGGGVFTFRISSAIRNTIIDFNNATTGPNYSNDGTNTQYSYCCSTPLLPGTGNMTTNPLLADITAGDCHLQPGSPCIDAGNNDEAPAFDYEFNDRPLDGNGDGSAIVDIGAYEYTTNRLSAPAAVAASDGTYASIVRVTWDALSGASAYDIWRNTNVNFLTATRIGENVAPTYCHDTNAITGYSYYYWVKAKTSPFSSSDTGWRAYLSSSICADYDGDGKADPAVYEGSNGTWYFKLSASGYGLVTVSFGGMGYSTCVGDYDGDLKADPAVYQAATGNWYVQLSGSGYAVATLPAFGGSAYQAVAGDYDGDGKTDPAIYNTTSGDWQVAMSSLGYGIASASGFGGTGFTAVQENYDSDNRTDAAIYNQTNGNWTVLMSASSYITATLWSFGGIGYMPVLGDFDGDGLADPAIYQEATSTWSIKLSGSGYAAATLAGFGGTGYETLAADYDGDGLADPTLLDMATGIWHVKLSASGYATATLVSGWTP